MSRFSRSWYLKWLQSLFFVIPSYSLSHLIHDPKIVHRLFTYLPYLRKYLAAMTCENNNQRGGKHIKAEGAPLRPFFSFSCFPPCFCWTEKGRECAEAGRHCGKRKQKRDLRHEGATMTGIGPVGKVFKSIHMYASCVLCATSALSFLDPQLSVRLNLSFWRWESHLCVSRSQFYNQERHQLADFESRPWRLPRLPYREPLYKLSKCGKK